MEISPQGHRTGLAPLVNAKEKGPSEAGAFFGSIQFLSALTSLCCWYRTSNSIPWWSADLARFQNGRDQLWCSSGVLEHTLRRQVP